MKHGKPYLPRSVIQGNIWPAIPDKSAAQMLAIQQQLESSQWWSEEILRKLQLQQLSQLLSHASRTIPFYQSRLIKAGFSPGNMLTEEQWKHIPLLTRNDIQQVGDALISSEIPEHHGKVNQVQTSGSTGRPVKVLHTSIANFFWRACTLRDHYWHRRDLSLKLAAIRPEVNIEPGTGVSNSGWGPSTDIIYETGPSAVLSSSTDIKQQAIWLCEQNPDYFLSLPSNIIELAHHFSEKGGALSSLKEVRTYGEVAGNEVRKVCREVWDVPVVDIYSATEAGYIALQCPEHEHYHVQSETMMVEVLDEDGNTCGPNEVGRIVVTPMHNYAMPLIRYALGDYAEVGERCDCGRGLPVLKRIMGRTRNMVVLPDGRKHYPSFPANLWMDITPIRQLQLVQHDLENIEARLVMERPMQATEQQQFITMLQERFGYPFTISITSVDAIERSASGKYEDFVSKVHS